MYLFKFYTPLKLFISSAPPQNDEGKVHILHKKHQIWTLDVLSLAHHSKSFVLFEEPQSEIHHVQ